MRTLYSRQRSCHHLIFRLLLIQSDAHRLDIMFYESLHVVLSQCTVKTPPYRHSWSHTLNNNSLALLLAAVYAKGSNIAIRTLLSTSVRPVSPTRMTTIFNLLLYPDSILSTVWGVASQSSERRTHGENVVDCGLVLHRYSLSHGLFCSKELSKGSQV